MNNHRAFAAVQSPEGICTAPAAFLCSPICFHSVGQRNAANGVTEADVASSGVRIALAKDMIVGHDYLLAVLCIGPPMAVMDSPCRGVAVAGEVAVLRAPAAAAGGIGPRSRPSGVVVLLIEVLAVVPSSHGRGRGKPEHEYRENVRAADVSDRMGIVGLLRCADRQGR